MNQHVPRILSWNTTNQCNLKCSHCYMDAKGTEGWNELSTEEGKRLIDQIANVSKCILVLSGGEPLMRADIFELAEHGRSRGLRVVMGTNGTLITEKVAERMVSSGISRVAISLDGCDNSVHDGLRKVKGSFDAAVAGTRACIKAGLPFQINTTVITQNYAEIPDLIKFAKDLGAVESHLFFLVQTGRGSSLTDITPVEYESMLQGVLPLEQEIGIHVKPTCAPMYMRISKQNGGDAGKRYSRGCLAGITYCRINPEGGVYPCPYLPVEVGNVREKDFGDIWQNSSLFHDLRDYSLLKGKCGRCGFKDVCGGCRARAFASNGDVLSQDPMCPYRPGEVAE
jgi:AdoMet-dependent heme synthase